MEISLILLLTFGLFANVVWTLYLFRKHKAPRSAAGAALSDVDGRVERLLSEIHRVTSANVEMLEGRIDALREVGGLADERLKRIRVSLTELEVLLNRISRVKKSMAESPLPEDSTDFSEPAAQELSASPPKLGTPKSRSETVWTLHRQGMTERQIAQKMDLGIAEVRFLLKLSEPGGKPKALAAEDR